jgi:hypothetical protein
MSDDLEKLRLEHELRQLKEKEQEHAQRTKGWLFLAIWLLPLFGMQISGYEPKADIGPMSILGFWFLGVPIAFWLYCRLNKSKDE